MEKLFYVQDSRSYVGNDILWWALGGAGYTTNLRKAQTYTLEQAQRLQDGRHTDIPWPKDYIDARVRPAVDIQYCNKKEALLDSGIVLRKPPKIKAEKYRCFGCGIFLRRIDIYGNCPRCNYDNHP